MGPLRKVGVLALVLLLLLAACLEPEETAVPTRTIAPSATAAQPVTGAMGRANTPTPSPVPTVVPTPTPSPTPIVPLITAADQVLNEDGLVTIATVQTPLDGWLVIYAQDAGGDAGEVLAYTAVTTGSEENVTLTVEPLATTPQLIAMLHVDAGETGEFEFPGADEPLTHSAGAVVTLFGVTIEFDLPAVAVSDQMVAVDGLVRIDSIYASVPGWAAVHEALEGEPGALFGHVYIEAGLHEGVLVPIPWREAPPTLLAVLYSDAGRERRLDYPGADEPVQINGDLVARPFRVTYPPDVFILDQPVVDGQIVVERVLSDGPGWIVVHYDEEGEPGLIIGFAPLQDGVNEEVIVPLVETAITDPMYVMLHQDTGDIGEFDFPRDDPQLTYNDIVIDPFPFSITPGNILYTADQQLLAVTESEMMTVTVPQAIVDLEAWVVIHNDDGGEPGEILGQTWIPPGINRDIMVLIPLSAETEVLHAVLYHDFDGDQEFDFPDGLDVPLLRNGRVIRAPFLVTGNP